MDGMLSQDEINALLQGMDLSDTADGGDAAADPTPENSTAENYNNENEAAENAAPAVSYTHLAVKRKAGSAGH